MTGKYEATLAKEIAEADFAKQQLKAKQDQVKQLKEELTHLKKYLFLKGMH